MINTELKQIHDDAKALFARAVRLSKKLKDQRETAEAAQHIADPLEKLRFRLLANNNVDEEVATRAARRLWDSVEVIAAHIGLDEAIKGYSK